MPEVINTELPKNKESLLQDVKGSFLLYNNNYFMHKKSIAFNDAFVNTLKKHNLLSNQHPYDNFITNTNIV